MDKCRICNVEECIKNKCGNDNPYMCINGPASGGCNSNAQFWPNKPNDCYDCCDTTICQNINNSYRCHSTTRNCEGSPLPPDRSQNRFATKEECERVMKLCRRPGPRPIPPGPRTCHICQEVDGMVVDDPNTCMRADPNHDINNCCCEAGQMCRIRSGPRQGQEACNPVWAKAQLDANAACPPGFSWNSYASQTSGLPCVRM